MTQLFSNNATTTLATAYGLADGYLTTADGSIFESPTSPEFQVVTVTDGTNITIFKCTSRTSNVLTVTTEQEGTTDYAYAVGSIVSARATADTYERIHSTVRGINAQTGTTYIPVLGDKGKLIKMSNAASNTLTVPPNVDVAFELYTRLYVMMEGAGVTTIAPGAAVTIYTPTTLVLAQQYDVVTLVQIAADVWIYQPGPNAEGGEFSDSVFRIQDNGDDTKELAFEVSAITTATTRTITVPDRSFTLGQPESLVIPCSDETTALTTGSAKVTFRMPYAFTLTAVRASATTAPTGATLTVDINETGTTILSTKLTIDATEKTSTTAATPAVISDAALADDAEITIDIDQIGSSVAGAGLKVILLGYRA